MSPSLRNAFALALAGLLPGAAALAGCSQEGATPQCKDNVTKDGIRTNVVDPCTTFGQCLGTYSAQYSIGGAQMTITSICSLDDVQAGRCSGGTTDAMVCCCAMLSRLNEMNDGNGNATYEFIQYAYEGGACVNKKTGEVATQSFTDCLYGYGEVDANPSGGGGGAGGSGGAGGAGGAGGGP